ncbi:MAG: hypothetical protein G01um101444_459 [Parcubacteria group bacterium Gr01-1014_44]|nr:MAG: hypothetical protein G01um101444_459 [Parcubacteria group bacterium Gr01-1014_44]
MLPEGTELCFIFNGFKNPSVTIATLIFKGETEDDVKRRLDKSLATIPFRTLYSYVISGHGQTFQSFFKKVVITEIIDAPGIEIVTISLRVECESKFFLPRDPVTGDFVDIEKQVKCLEALKVEMRGS